MVYSPASCYKAFYPKGTYLAHFLHMVIPAISVLVPHFHGPPSASSSRARFFSPIRRDTSDTYPGGAAAATTAERGTHTNRARVPPPVRHGRDFPQHRAGRVRGPAEHHQRHSARHAGPHAPISRACSAGRYRPCAGVV